jgi:hypothetical protein
MPKDRMHGHRPQRIEKRQTMDYLEGSHDLTMLDGGKEKNPIMNALHFVTLAPGSRVPSHLLEGRLSNLVAARFYLPFPKAVVTPLPAATVPVSTQGPEVAGTIDLEYDFTNEVKIGNLRVTSDAIVEIANVMDPNPTSGVTYKLGTPLKHVFHYYSLLDGFAETPAGIMPQLPPEVKTTRDHVSLLGPSYVNPVECTVGTACEESDPACGAG